MLSKGITTTLFLLCCFAFSSAQIVNYVEYNGFGFTGSGNEPFRLVNTMTGINATANAATYGACHNYVSCKTTAFALSYASSSARSTTPPAPGSTTHLGLGFTMTNNTGSPIPVTQIEFDVVRYNNNGTPRNVQLSYRVDNGTWTSSIQVITQSTSACAYTGTNGFTWTLPSSVCLADSSTFEVKFQPYGGSVWCDHYEVIVARAFVKGEPLSAPLNTGASNITCDAFQANWSSVTGASSYYLYVFDVNNGTVHYQGNVGNVTNRSFSNLPIGYEYDYRVYATGSCGNSAWSTYHNLLLSQGPQPGLQPDTSMCDGASLTLNATTGFSSYQWSTGDSSNSITLSQAGQYSLTVTDAGNCVGTDTFNLTYFPEPDPRLAADTSLCAGDSLNLVAASGFNQYTWSTGDSTQSIMLGQAGQYLLTVTDSNSCVGHDTFNLAVNANPVVNLGADTILCEGGSLTLDASQSGTASYTWSTGDTTSAITVRFAGTYSVAVTNSDGCQDTDTITLNGLIAPRASFSIDTSLCPQISFTGILGAGPTNSWRWDFGDGIGTDTVVNPTYSYFNAGNGAYQVSLIQENACGADTVTQLVEIDCIVGLATSAQSNGLSLYPNPARDVIMIGVDHHFQGPAQVRVFDMQGKLLMDTSLNNRDLKQQFRLELPALPSQTYMLELHQGGQRWHKLFQIR